MIKNFADWLIFTVAGIAPNSRLGESLNFFVYDTIKIIFLLFVMTVLMGFVNSYFPVDRVRTFLTKRKWYGGLRRIIAAFMSELNYPEGWPGPFC
jgi:uncharacterized protein